MTSSKSRQASTISFVQPTLIVTLVCSALLWMAPAARAANIVKINHSGEGAVAAFLTCAPELNGDLLCEDFIVNYNRVFSARQDPLFVTAAELDHSKAHIHPDGSATVFLDEVGFSDNANGFYDGQLLTVAHMDGITLDMNDIDRATGAITPNGRAITLGPFDWTAASSIYVFGNDGPFGFDLPRKYQDRCVTLLENAHERFTTAHVTGTIDGISVENYGPEYLPWPGTEPADALGAIFRSDFTVVVTTHGPGC